MKEIYKVIKSHPDYKISNLGNLISYRTEIPKKLLGSIGIKKGVVYREFSLQRSGLNIKDTRKCHILVANAFLDGPNIKRGEYYIRHVNGNTLDNKVSNLEKIPWVHLAQGMRIKNQDPNVSRILSIDDVLNIRNMYHTGLFSPKDLSEDFIISRDTIKRIVTGASYVNADGPVCEISKTSPELNTRMKNAVSFIIEHSNDIEVVENTCKKLLEYLS